jgi:hypothetical protein
MRTTITYWEKIEEEDTTPLKFKRKFVDVISPEWDSVNEWWPLLYAKGQSNITKTIVNLWKGLYPDRATNNKYYEKLMNSIKWWNLHTDLRQASVGDSKMRLISREVNI